LLGKLQSSLPYEPSPSPHLFLRDPIFQIGSCTFAWGQPQTAALLLMPSATHGSSEHFLPADIIAPSQHLNAFDGVWGAKAQRVETPNPRSHTNSVIGLGLLSLLMLSTPIPATFPVRDTYRVFPVQWLPS
jgi:hypothetical protein